MCECLKKAQDTDLNAFHEPLEQSQRLIETYPRTSVR